MAEGEYSAGVIDTNGGAPQYTEETPNLHGCARRRCDDAAASARRRHRRGW
jgi:hypothetical protein